jgi:CubicO group peptidase (beta-lactamase class C family)
MLLLLTSCIKEEETLKKPFISYKPTQMNDGWQVSSAASENIDTVQLSDIYNDFHGDPEIWQVRSLLVFRNGKLVAESYTKDDEDITTPRAIWSATKQVLGLLTGIALEKQLIKDINDPISDYLIETEDYPDKLNITIEHLLTMRSGIDYSNDGLGGQTADILRQLPDKVTSFILGLPLADLPGKKAVYKDGDPQLVSSVIQAACGKSTADWAKKVLFDPMNIKYLEWTQYKDGTTLGGFGILTTPRELAKFGQCVLDSGNWKGTTIVSKEWIAEMTTVRVPDLYGFQFGYLWWKDASRDLTIMSGHGGQYVFINPTKKLLVVMTSEPNTQGDFQFNRELALKWVDRIETAVN